jgi:hypothetical protein
MNLSLQPTVTNVRDAPRNTGHTNRTRNGSLRVLGYYVSPTVLYNQALADGIIGEDTDDNYYWIDFQDRVSREAGVEQDRFFVKVTKGPGACIMLGNNATREAMHPEGFEERLKLIQQVLKTKDKPKWYVLAGPDY